MLYIRGLNLRQAQKVFLIIFIHLSSHSLEQTREAVDLYIIHFCAALTFPLLEQTKNDSFTFYLRGLVPLHWRFTFFIGVRMNLRARKNASGSSA